MALWNKKNTKKVKRSKYVPFNKRWEAFADKEREFLKPEVRDYSINGIDNDTSYSSIYYRYLNTLGRRVEIIEGKNTIINLKKYLEKMNEKVDIDLSNTKQELLASKPTNTFDKQKQQLLENLNKNMTYLTNEKKVIDNLLEKIRTKKIK